MKKLMLLLIVFSFSLTVKGQDDYSDKFYNYLKSTLLKNDSYPINLSIINYGCLGEQTRWNVNLKNKNGNIEVSFYSEKPTEIRNFTKTESHLDTVFNVSKTELVKKIEFEKTDLLSNRVIIEGSYSISINYNESAKEFITRRAEGLFYILRYNKSWKEYFGQK